MNPLNSSPLLKVERLCVRMGDASILSEVCFEVSSGEYLSIIGPNGAGKTTLLKTLLGLNPFFSGEISLQGKALSEYGYRERARWMAYVPQQQVFSDYTTVLELVKMGRYPYASLFSQPTQADQQAVREALRLTHCEALSDRWLTTLSGGERQKVMIAAALAQQPKILLLDEPVTFLDPKNQVEINALLRRINRETGTTLISVTHDLNSAMAASSHFLALKSGQVVFHGAPKALLQPESLTEIYDVPFCILDTPAENERFVYPLMPPESRPA